ncbi:hypothetical protein A4V12_16395 [Streptomyces noursei]|nr:hypothetical protein A4V12_16395 [Streptomyces noursei]
MPIMPRPSTETGAADGGAVAEGEDGEIAGEGEGEEGVDGDMGVLLEGLSGGMSRSSSAAELPTSTHYLVRYLPSGA